MIFGSAALSFGRYPTPPHTIDCPSKPVNDDWLTAAEPSFAKKGLSIKAAATHEPCLSACLRLVVVCLINCSRHDMILAAYTTNFTTTKGIPRENATRKMKYIIGDV